jgi:hypothetical protein
MAAKKPRATPKLPSKSFTPETHEANGFLETLNSEATQIFPYEYFTQYTKLAISIGPSNAISTLSR